MIRFGTIGTNWIVDRFIDAASKLEDFSLQAVYSRTEEKAKAFAEKHGVAQTYTSMKEMAASSDIDAVYIASPTSLHAEHAIECMKQGKHVLVEKAIASNEVEVKQMIEVAKQHNVLLMEALKTTHLPNFKVVKDHLHKIGPVRRYFASYCQYSSRYDKFNEGIVLNAFDPKFSNGSLIDIGIYCIYPMVALFGEPDNLQANAYMLSTGVDGQGSIIVNYEKMQGSVMFSKITNSYVPSEIQGEDGSIIIDSISEPTHVEIRYHDGSTEVISKEQEANAMYYEAQAFIDLIKDGKTECPINSFANSLITTSIIEQARKQIGVVFPSDQ
ncbi:Gfo/Idh/MocA family oxidoreductase [Aquibacillus koreensis]|uniref:Gfo/Idh/MocA family oxidoreductase n=1 Tax=Aquibacillus koreensis TaxID=279446 RepID=A0A9X4AKI5_9BACI|nr:Gfo/Idh/MocA family oxidoreductase [Aquibacillus koreensis]MCT2536810.1 Gfo/Idh/MocA family oxidoreductase [Aquibacillus koreensis]MDC3421433.1 Gfo/Idh/MocA family oxidoreductase [Aquibacillus koreensis]